MSDVVNLIVLTLVLVDAMLIAFAVNAALFGPKSSR